MGEIIIVCVCFQKILTMNATSDGLDDLEALFGFWIEGIILPIVACLGIAGDTLMSSITRTNPHCLIEDYWINNVTSNTNIMKMLSDYEKEFLYI